MRFFPFVLQNLLCMLIAISFHYHVCRTHLYLLSKWHLNFSITTRLVIFSLILKNKTPKYFCTLFMLFKLDTSFGRLYSVLYFVDGRADMMTKKTNPLKNQNHWQRKCDKDVYIFIQLNWTNFNVMNETNHFKGACEKVIEFSVKWNFIIKRR